MMAADCDYRSDPYLMSPSFAVPDGDRLVVKIRLKSETGGAGQLFYFTEHTLEKDSVRFGVPAGDWQDVWVTIPPSSPHVRFRLDPPGTSGTASSNRSRSSPGCHIRGRAGLNSLRSI